MSSFQTTIKQKKCTSTNVNKHTYVENTNEKKLCENQTILQDFLLVKNES